jgi:hypothetical protein
MSEWYYIRLAFGLTYFVIAGYALLLLRRRATAEAAVREMGGEVE